jgi:hypothetical protein
LHSYAVNRARERKRWDQKDMKRKLVVLSILATVLLSPCLADEADTLRDELARAKQKIAALEQRCALQKDYIKTFERRLNDPAALDRVRRLALLSGAKRNECLSELKQFAHAKDAWVLKNKAEVGELPTKVDLVPFYTSSPECPGGGLYHIRRVGQLVRCNIHGPWPEKKDPNPKVDSISKDANTRL